MNKKFSVLIKHKISSYNTTITIPPDKSISHRCIIIASQAIGLSKVKCLDSVDIRSTINGLRLLGIKIVKKKGVFHIYGNTISGFKKFTGVIDCGNSGTTLRSMLGLLTCYPHPVTLTGDASLRKRPVRRLTNYLERIGAVITHPKNNKITLPIKIHGTLDWALAQQHYVKVSSAQITSALIYAGLQTKGETEIIETFETRDHTQRLLKYLGADIQIKKLRGKRITRIRGQVEMHSFSIKVPGDFSSAIFLIVQTLLTKKSSLLIKSVCVNENRIGAYYILKAMGAKIQMLNKRKYFNEDIADLFVHSSKLKGIVCPIKLIVKSIDDLPAIWVACALARGQSYFKEIFELTLKESNRIKTMSENLNRFGIKTHPTKDSLKIYGNPKIKVNKLIKIPATLDHRCCLCMHVFANVTSSKVLINGFNTVASSFPNWLKLQRQKFGTKYEIKKN